MNLGYSFPQTNVLINGDNSSYRSSGCFASHISLLLKPVYSRKSHTGNSRFAGACQKKKVKKMIALSRSCSSHVTAIGEFDGHCRDLSLKRSAICSSHGNISKNMRLGLRPRCQVGDSLAYIDGNGRNVDFIESRGDDTLNSDSSVPGVNITDKSNVTGEESEGEETDETPQLDVLRDVLLKAVKEFEVARRNSSMFEEKTQRISEAAIAMKDEAENTRNDVKTTLDTIQEVVNEESIAKEEIRKATMALSLAEARLQVVLESSKMAKRVDDSSEDAVGASTSNSDISEEEKLVLTAHDDIKECKNTLENCETNLKRLQRKKDDLEMEVIKLTQAAEIAEMNALKAEEDVANIMILAEEAVAFELEAAQKVNDAEIELERAEKALPVSHVDTSETTRGLAPTDKALVEEDKVITAISTDLAAERDQGVPLEDSSMVSEGSQSDKTSQTPYQSVKSDDLSDHENRKPHIHFSKEAELEAGKVKNVVSTKKQETLKDRTRESSSMNSPKASPKKSSGFFSDVMDSARKQFPKLVLGLMLIGVGITLYSTRAGRNNQLLQQSGVTAESVEEVSLQSNPLILQAQNLSNKMKELIEKLPHQEINGEEASLFDMLWLLLASVIFVPIFTKIPGGSPVLGYLAAGILIGPYGLSIIRHVHGTKAIAEFGVVFLLFNIGLELSVERLSSMKKYVFGLGSAQVLVTAVAIGLLARYVAGLPGPAAIVIGNGLALSSTAVVLQVLQERGESTSRHGRATFSVLLFQDLAVVVLLILIPLISPNSSKGGLIFKGPVDDGVLVLTEGKVGFQAIAEALGLAAVKAIVAITAIVAGGRLLLRPIYKQIAENQNAEIFSANTLLVILGTSLLTARAGLSMALGAFLAGLLLAETEFSLQVESDIAPYRGLLLGLFFMTVGMSIDPKLLVSNFPVVMGTLTLLIGGKAILVALIGKVFGISIISAIRVGLLLAPGGEFAFVAFGEAVNQGIMSSQLSSLLFLVVGISMALTPWLAAGGQLIASRFEQHDMRSLLPVESETDDLQGHIIICGFGRVGQIIAQLLSERLIPFVALDVRSDQVAIGRALDLPVYFGDAGSREVLHKIGAHRACAAAITLDSPGANYRTVWALSKYFPNVKTFVRAHDVDHGLNLEKAGATAVVPETLEPSLQLAAAVLAQAKLPTSEIAATINEFRSRHLSELTELSEISGSSLGYGYSRMMNKPKSQASDSSDEVTEGHLAI